MRRAIPPVYYARASVLLLLGDKLAAERIDLLEGDHPVQGLHDGVFAHSEHAARARRGLDPLFDRLLKDRLLDVLVHPQYLEHRRAAAGAVRTLLRRAGVVEVLERWQLGPVRLRQVGELPVEISPDAALDREDLAAFTELPDETLPDHGDQGGRDEERVDAHVDESWDRAGGGVGVDRREDEVAGQRRLHREHGGLLIADLADHDNVRVLAQDGAQARGEGVADLGTHLAL